jgi:hypothetical protein
MCLSFERAAPFTCLDCGSHGTAARAQIYLMIPMYCRVGTSVPWLAAGSSTVYASNTT